MIKNDIWITQMAELGMIRPFLSSLVRQVEDRKIISCGLSSYGYDIRLSNKEFYTFKHIPGKLVDPKKFDTNHLEKAEIFYDDSGEFFIIPGNSYGLGVAVEYIDIPDNITVIAIGKSTYCRCGIIANLTPVEAGWRGHLTLEFSNSSPADCKIYANEGIVQLLFLEGEPCYTTYNDRNGKYQNQSEEVTIARL